MATVKFERQSYRRDPMESWQHNVYAIAKSLEALRLVDRYGVTRRGEQYTGWKALPAGSGEVSTHMNRDMAVAILRSWAPKSKADEPLEQLARWARVGAHPDRHSGDHGPSDDVLRAIAALRLDVAP
jgi:hypothetical protein